MPRLARTNTDKIDADKLCRIIKMQVLSGEQTISPVTIPPKEIPDLRALFSTYRLMKKQNTQVKNRIHSLLKEQLYRFTREEIFGKKDRAKIREVSADPVLRFQVNRLLDRLERAEGDVETLKERILAAASPFMPETGILTGMKGVSVFIAIAIIADIIDVSRFRDAKAFTSYLRSAPYVAFDEYRRDQQEGQETGGGSFDPIAQSCTEFQCQAESVVYTAERI
jgi:transposase